MDYKVQSGNTLSGIALKIRNENPELKQYKLYELVDMIAKGNGIKDADKIQIGQVIKFDTIFDTKGAQPAVTSAITKSAPKKPIQEIKQNQKQEKPPTYKNITTPIKLNQRYNIASALNEKPTQNEIQNASDSTKVLNFAQKLLSKNINEGDNSFLNITKGKKQSWCADTVNYIYEKAYGNNVFGNRAGTKEYKSCVNELKAWGLAKGKFVSSSKVSEGKKFTDEENLKQTLAQAKAGDIIIWDVYSKIVVDGKPELKKASHTGILQSSDNGEFKIYEGNANNYKTNAKGEYFRVHTAEQGKNGNQAIGELQEVMPNDGFLLKTYKLPDLIASGFSGFIKMN